MLRELYGYGVPHQLLYYGSRAIPAEIARKGLYPSPLERGERFYPLFGLHRIV